MVEGTAQGLQNISSEAADLNGIVAAVGMVMGATVVAMLRSS